MTRSSSGIAIFATDDGLVAKIKAAAAQFGQRCFRLQEADLTSPPFEELPGLVFICAPNAAVAQFCDLWAAQDVLLGANKTSIITCSPSPDQTPDDLAKFFIAALREITPAQADAIKHPPPRTPPHRLV